MSALRRSGVSAALALCALAFAGHVRAQHGELGEEQDSEAESAEQPAAESESESEADSEPESEPSSGEAPEGGPAASGSPAVAIQAVLGGGLGTRSFLRPTSRGAQRLNDVLFPAVDVGLSIHVWPDDGFSLGMLLRYQSSVGLEVEERPLFGLPNTLGVQVERLEASVAPTFRLGDSPTSVALGFPLGFGLRSFWPEANEFRTPSYSLAGPQLRAELDIPFSSSFGLRLGPELLWMVMIDGSITDQGVASQGIAIGGEAALHLQLGAVLGVELSYRESHALASTTMTSASFEDVERFAVARLVGSL